MKTYKMQINGYIDAKNMKEAEKEARQRIYYINRTESASHSSFILNERAIISLKD